jgi:type VI secretion system secreted protein VgrG
VVDLSLDLDGAEHAALRVLRFTLHEHLNEPFALSVVTSSTLPDLDLEDLILRLASFSLDVGLAHVRGGGRRRLTGLCVAAEQLSTEPAGLSLYRFRLVPRLGLLTLRRDHRIFQRLTVPAILAQLLADYAIPATFHVDDHAFPVLDFKVQYGETDLVFFTRLCEEAGITFALRDDDARGSIVVLSDVPTEATPREGAPLPFVDSPTEAGEREYVTRVCLSHEARPLAVALRDFDFRNPAFPLDGHAVDAGHVAGVGVSSRLEHFDFAPGAFRIVNDAPTFTPVADHLGTTRHHPRAGERRAAHLLAGKNAAAHSITFDTNALDLAPGSIVSVLGHPHPSLGDARRLLVTELAIDGDRNQAWLTSAKAVLADRPYHPPRVTPRPSVQGLQSAIVTGPQGDELFTDEHGRVQVRFLWDRGSASDAASSCWIRVSQGWSGAGFGLWTLPRVGHEVLVGFLEGNPDEPIVIGRAPNAHHPPPSALPANATKAVWRSRSTPGSCGYNEISFEDRTGAERFYERAERDKATDVLRDESLSVGGKRSHGVSGDEDRAIGGTVRERIGGALHETVKGERRDRIGAAHSVSVGGDRQEDIGGRWAIDADGAIHLFSGQAIVIEAPDITLKSGSAFLRVAGGVTTTGGYPAIAPGAPGAGEGSAPAAPELPGGCGGEIVPPGARPRVRLPLLGFPGLPAMGPMAPGMDPEKPILCDAMCSCKTARDVPNAGPGPAKRGTTGRNRQQCVADRLWAYDRALSNQSTIKAEVPYDMSQAPPVPIMSRNDPTRPTHSRPAGSRIPDVVLVNDPTKPPTQNNIRKIIEMKFDGDPPDPAQLLTLQTIAGQSPVEVWTPATCGCGPEEPEPKPMPVPDPALSLAVVLALLVVLMADDLIPGLEADDVAIPPLLARLAKILAN